MHRLQRGRCECGREHQRATSRGRNNCAVDVRIAWWATPRHITFGTVRRGDAPNVWTKRRKLVREVHAKSAVRQRCSDGVLKVVDTVTAVFAAIAVVDPCMCVLVHEQRHANGREVCVTLITITVTPQRIPGSCRNRMRRRRNREHVQNRVLAVRVPTRLQKTGLRFPTM